MLRDEDRQYHETRALAELQLAEEAADRSVAQAHRELAALHRRKMIEVIGRPASE